MDKYDNTNIELETAIFSVSCSEVSINYLKFQQSTLIKKFKFIFIDIFRRKVSGYDC